MTGMGINSISALNSTGVLNSAGSGSGPKVNQAVTMDDVETSENEDSDSSIDGQGVSMMFGRPDTPSFIPSAADLDD